jgi:hypothetical protein
MIAVKFSKKNNNNQKIYEINKHIVDFFKSKTKTKLNIIDDSKSIELVSSDNINGDDSKIELTYKKTIAINNMDLLERENIDKLICEIKDFCEQAVKIDHFTYTPLLLREKKDKDGKQQPSITRNGS